MDKEKVKNLVVFSILMQNNDGIISKHPHYLLEKFESCMRGMKSLDAKNIKLFKDYCKHWHLQAKEA